MRLTILSQQARLASRRGFHDQALTLLEGALGESEGVAGKNNVFTASLFQSIVQEHRHAGDQAAAAAAGERALTILKEVYGDGHPSCAATHMLLAEIYRDRHRLELSLKHSGRCRDRQTLLLRFDLKELATVQIIGSTKLSWTISTPSARQWTPVWSLAKHWSRARSGRNWRSTVPRPVRVRLSARLSTGDDALAALIRGPAGCALLRLRTARERLIELTSAAGSGQANGTGADFGCRDGCQPDRKISIDNWRRFPAYSTLIQPLFAALRRNACSRADGPCWPISSAALPATSSQSQRPGGTVQLPTDLKSLREDVEISTPDSLSTFPRYRRLT